MHRFRRLISSDIPFARDDAHRLLPAMIACLTGFAALMLVISLCLSGALSAQSKAVVGMLQVEVPRNKANDANFMQAVRETLLHTTGVEEVALLGQSQMESLLKPWLGDDFALADLPVPVMFDVKTKVENHKAAVDMVALRNDLIKLDTGIKVEDPGPWVRQMVNALRLLQGVVLTVAALLMLCVLGMIILVARTNLRLHFKTVSLLHMFGATDEYILRQFQWNNAWLAARGAFSGVLGAAMLFVLVVILSARMDSPIMPQIDISLPQVLVFLLLPMATACIALIATRVTVKSMLEHMH